MPTSLAAQLPALQSLDAARLASHTQSTASFLFTPAQAQSHDLDTVHTLGLSGLDELKELDPALTAFEDALFNDAAKKTDRTMLNKAENESLDATVDGLLKRLGPHLPVRAAAKVLEWLIRRFRIHEFNIPALILAFLPYHDSTPFARILSLLPLSSPSAPALYRFLLPSQRSSQALPRAVLVNAMLKDADVLRLVAEAVPESTDAPHRALASFWSVTLLEYLARVREVEDGPRTSIVMAVKKGLTADGWPDAQAGARMVFAALSQKVQLPDKAVAALLHPLARHRGDAEAAHVLATVFAVVEAQEELETMPDAVVDAVLSIPDAPTHLLSSFQRYALPRTFTLLLPPLTSRLPTDPSAPALLSALLSSPSLPPPTARQIAEHLLRLPASHTAHTPLIALAQQRWPSEVERAVERVQVGLGDDARKALFETLKSATASGVNVALAGAKDGAFLGSVSADASTRALAVSELLSSDDASADAPTLLARTADPSPAVLSALYGSPSALLTHLPSAALLSSIRAALAVPDAPRAVVRAHVAFLAGPFVERHPDLGGEVEDAVWGFLLVTKARGKLVKGVWETLKGSKLVEEGALKGAGQGLLKAVEEDRAAEGNLRVAEIIGDNLVALPTLPSALPALLARLSPTNPEPSSRLLAYLVVQRLLQKQLPNEHALACALAVLDSLDGPAEDLCGEEKALADAVYGKPGHARTMRRVQGLVLEEAVRRVRVEEEVGWLERELEETAPLRRYATVLYTLSAAPSSLTPLATSLLRQLFTSLRDSAPLFLASIWTSPATSPTHVRVAALRHAEAFLRAVQKDFQVLLPALAVALADPEERVRRAALGTLKAVVEAGKREGVEVYGFDRVYGKSSETVQYLEPADALAYAKQLVEADQAFVADKGYLGVFHKAALSKVKGEGKKEARTKSSITHYLLSHIASWRSAHGRMTLLRALQGIPDKARLATLLPLPAALVDPASDESRALERVQQTQRDELLELVFASFDKAAAGTVEQDATARETLRKALVGAEGLPSRITEVVLKHLQRGLYAAVTPELRLEFADLLLELTESAEADHALLVKDSLKGIPLDEPTLVTLLALAKEGLATSPETTPKRAKASAGTTTDLQAASHVRLLSVLEWAASQTHAPSAPLLTSLFETLATVTELHAAAVDSSENDFAEQLILSLLSAVTAAVQDWAPLAHTVRVDTVVNCIRVSKNPQTFQQALLLISALARLAPESVLHNVMPIFTFMGANVLQRDDAFSFGVVQKTIEGVVPVVVNSLREKTASAGALELECKSFLMTFTDAANHIPKHRRLLLFTFLIETLGADVFLAPVTALLVDKVLNKVVRQQGADASQSLFLPVSLFGAFDADMQLNALERVLAEAESLLVKQSGGDVGPVFLERPIDPEKQTSEQTLKKRQALALLIFTQNLLEGKKLRLQIVKADPTAYEQQLLVIVRALLSLSREGRAATDGPDVQRAAKAALRGTLNLLSVEAFANIVSALVSSGDDEVKLGALQVLRLRLASVKASHREDVSPAVVAGADHAVALLKPASTAERTADQQLALDTLRTIALSAIPAEHNVLTRAIPVILAYGRATGEAGAAAALAVLESFTAKLNTRLIPSLKDIVAFAKAQLSATIASELVQTHALRALKGLVNAVPTFIGAHLPGVLIAVLQPPLLDATDSTAASSLNSLLSAIAKRVPPKNLFPAMLEIWEQVTAGDRSGVFAYLTLLRRSLHTADRAYVVENHKNLFKFFLGALELRWEKRKVFAPEEMSELESFTIEAFLEMVIKLNETTFRPLFKRLYDWAVIELAGDKQAFDDGHANGRLITFFRLFDRLLDQLKAIITPYTAISYEHIKELLQAFPTKKVTNAELWHAVLSVVEKSLEHDGGAFWTSDRVAGLTPALVSQLAVGPALSISEEDDALARALAALAKAARVEVALRSINSSILMQTRNDDDARVRIAALDVLDRLWREMSDSLISFIPETVSSFLAELLEDTDDRVIAKAKVLLRRIESETGESLESYLS